MDFFERQDTARRNTKWLLVYYPVALIVMIGSIYFVFAVALSRESLWDPTLLGYVSLGTVLLIGVATLQKIIELRGSGGTVAMMLGGLAVDPNTRDPDERKLLNVVEEMSIASGTPVPEVWVLRDERGINAFAAGHDIQDAAVAVTDGAMRLLSRDELQGVIAHEFSHILHGDMRLNTRLMGLLHGILALTVIGRIFMRTRGRKNPLPVIGLALFIIGSTGFFFGRLIKSAVSRQREYLADAAAVQFTRNPLGLAAALKKIGGLVHGSKLTADRAEEASHFFFARGVSGLLSTHPPLEKRIRLLDPSFDGKYPKVTLSAETFAEIATPNPTRLAPLVRPQAVLSQVGTPGAQHLHYASEFRQELPPQLDLAAHEPADVIHLVFALLLSDKADVRATQLQQLGAQSERTKWLATLIGPLPVTFRLPLLSLACPAIKRLSPEQYQEFARCLEMLVACDKEIDLFEYVLKTVVSRNVRRASPVQYYSLRPLLPDCALLISALAWLGQDPQAAFQVGTQTLSPEASGFTLMKLEECGLQQIDEVLNRLAQSSPAIKKRVLNACAHTVAADNAIQPEEAELLRAIAETLDCPIPPFIKGVA